MVFRQSRLPTWRKFKQPRYGSTPHTRTECLSGRWHKSGHEANVCNELRLRKIAGNGTPPDRNGISDYLHEYKVELILDGFFLWNHYVDFYTDDLDGGHTFVEAKGIEFTDWKRNWRILQHMFRNDPMIRFQLVKQ